MKIYVNEILDSFKPYILNCIGAENASFSGYSTINKPINGTIIWTKGNGLSHLFKERTKTNEVISNVIISDCFSDDIQLQNNTFILTSNPRLLFVKILEFYFSKSKNIYQSVNQPVSEDSLIHKSAQIGPFCIIDENVIIGANCILEGNIRIYSDVVLKENVIVQSGTIIGADVMSFVKDLDGSFVRFPSLGRVIIDNFVEIGSNVTVVKSSLEETRIGRDTKINSNSYIGSSVMLGCNNYVASGVNINGSVIIGDSNFLGSGSVVRNKIKIGNGNTIGAGAVVVNDVLDNLVLTGNPAEVNSKSKGVSL